MNLRIALLAAATILTFSTRSAPAQPTAPRFKLYISLFSSIPDAAGDQFRLMRLRIKREFEAKIPVSSC